jgi:hypothetical protein
VGLVGFAFIENGHVRDSLFADRRPYHRSRDDR